MKAGTHTFTGYFHDNNLFQGVADVDVSVDGGTIFTDAVSVAYSTGAAPAPVGVGSFQFTSDGENDVVVRVSADNSGGGNGASLMNGFSIARTPYTSWQVEHWGDAGNPAAAGDQDPDNDSRYNLLEFVFGTDPLMPDSASDKMGFDGETLTITRLTSSAAGVSYEIEESPTLAPGSWATAAGTVLTVVSTNGDFETVEITKPGGWITGGDPRMFVRLKVTNP